MNNTYNTLIEAEEKIALLKEELRIQEGRNMQLLGLLNKERARADKYESMRVPQYDKELKYAGELIEKQDKALKYFLRCYYSTREYALDDAVVYYYKLFPLER
jgi:hypothetical protein